MRKTKSYRKRRDGENEMGQNEMGMPDTFYRKKYTGTWCHTEITHVVRTGLYYCKRHRNLQILDIKTEDRWSDHRPKTMRVKLSKKKEKFERLQN